MQTSTGVRRSGAVAFCAKATRRLGTAAPIVSGMILLTFHACADAAAPQLVRDINTTIIPMSSYPETVGVFRGAYLFSATDASGNGLWRTDGTRAGTSLLARFGGLGVFSPFPPTLVTFGANGYFPAINGATGSQLWRTDSTAVGTHQVAALGPDPNGRAVQLDGVAGPNLLFVSGDTNGNQQLYATDGTAGGTRALTAFTGPVAGVVPGFIATGARFYFVAVDNNYAHQLWVSDGTAANTLPANAPAAYASAAEYNPRFFQLIGSQVLFTSSGLLWTIDTASNTIAAVTTSQGTPGFGPPAVLESGGLIGMNGFVLFISMSLPGPLELWRSDGTSVGTFRVAGVTAGMPTFNESQYPLFQKLGARALYLADDGQTGSQLWSSDGTSANTVRLTSIVQPANPGAPVAIPLGVVGNSGYFAIPNDANQTTASLWRTDGTPAGTLLVGGIPPIDMSEAGVTRVAGNAANVFVAVTNTSGTTSLYHYVPAGNQATLLRSGLSLYGSDQFVYDGHRLEFSVNDPVTGDEPWVSDGTPAGTRLLRDINPEVADADSTPQEFVKVKGKLVFSADDGIHGRELWQSDGTAAGTSLLVDINPGAPASNPNHLIAVNGDVYFFATDSTGQSHFMRLPAGSTIPVSLAALSPQSSYWPVCWQDASVAVGDKVIFAADDGTSGIELWTSNGTAVGTVRLADIYPGATGSNPCELTKLGGHVYFSASAPDTGNELWETDGTTAGTQLVADISPGPVDSFPFKLKAIQGALYFNADDGTHGTELWVSDGSRWGTRLLVDLAPGPSPSYASALGAANGRLLASVIVVTDPNQGIFEQQLWTMSLVGEKPMRLGAFQLDGSMTPQIDDGRLIFSGIDGSGKQAWASDGTAKATFPLTHFNASANQQPLWYEKFHDETLIGVSDTANSAQLWRTDGTRKGTSPLAEIPLPAPANSSSIVRLPLGHQRLTLGSHFFFTATASAAGSELYDVFVRE